jgi:hypothetical protein
MSAENAQPGTVLTATSPEAPKAADPRRDKFSTASNKTTMIKETQEKVLQLSAKIDRIARVATGGVAVQATQGELLRGIRNELTDLEFNFRAIVRMFNVSEDQMAAAVRAIRTEDFDEARAKMDEELNMEPHHTADKGGDAIVSLRFLNDDGAEEKALEIPRASVPLNDQNHQLAWTRQYIQGMKVGEKKKVTDNGKQMEIELLGARRKKAEKVTPETETKKD